MVPGWAGDSKNRWSTSPVLGTQKSLDRYTNIAGPLHRIARIDRGRELADQAVEAARGAMGAGGVQRPRPPLLDG